MRILGLIKYYNCHVYLMRNEIDFSVSLYFKDRKTNPIASKPKDGGLDIDSLVKRIDQKIAEMEKEEQAAKEEKNGVKEAVIEEPNTEEPKPVITEEKETYVPKTNDAISDDQFFDDFFGDD